MAENNLSVDKTYKFNTPKAVAQLLYALNRFKIHFVTKMQLIKLITLKNNRGIERQTNEMYHYKGV